MTRPEIKVRIRVKQGLLQGQPWSEKVYRVVSVWLGISEKSPKTQLPSGGWRCSPSRGGYREAPGSHLLFDALCASTSLRLRLPPTDELLHVGSGAARRALVISDFPIFPPPVPRDVALEPAQGKLSPLCACGRGAKSRADLAHLFQDFLRALGIFELARKASDFHERAVQLLIEELDAAALVQALGLKQRVFARPLGGRPLGHLSSRKAGIVRPRGGLFQKPCLHASEGRRGSHLEQLRRVFLSIWDHSSIWYSARSPAKISVLFLEDLDAALQRLTLQSLAVDPLRAIRSSARSRSLRS